MLNRIEKIQINEQVSLHRYNRLPRKIDWESSDFKEYAFELKLKNFHMGVFNRSHWDKCMTLRAMDQLGFLNNTITVINVGGGIDVINYYLSKHLKKIVSLDLYDDSWSTCPSDVLENPDLYAPFEYNRFSLEFKKMDARQVSLGDDTFSAAISIGPALNFIGDFEKIVHVLKEISKIVRSHGMLFMSLDLSLTEVKRPKGDSEYYFSPNSIGKLFAETSFKPICEIDLSNPDFMQEETRENRWLPPKITWNSIGVIPSRIMGHFPFFRIRRPTIFPVFIVARNEK